MERSIFVKNRKGQASIEFMLLLIIMLMYVQLIIVPSIDVAAASSEDVVRLGEARFAAEKLANTVNYVSASTGESKQTIKLFVPRETTIECNDTDNTIDFSVNMSMETGGIIGCSGTLCEKSIPVMTATDLVCVMSQVLGPNLATVVVNKEASGVVYVTG